MASAAAVSAPERTQQKLPLLCYKTKLCKFNALGRCNRGQCCTFAHTAVDLQPVPDLTRTKVCPSLINNGFCEEGHCPYAHDAVELRMGPYGSGKVLQQMAAASHMDALRHEDYMMQGVQVAHAMATQLAENQDAACGDADKPTIKKKKKLPASVLFKTRLCIYHQAGHCYKKKDCNFAHSLKEMRDAALAAAQPRPQQHECEQMKDARALGQFVSAYEETRSGSSIDSDYVEQALEGVSFTRSTRSWPACGSEPEGEPPSQASSCGMSGSEFLPPLPVTEEADLMLDMIPLSMVLSF